MKANKSKRNRHTGRMNAYTERVIKAGRKFKDSRGQEYYAARMGRGVSVVRATLSQAFTFGGSTLEEISENSHKVTKTL